MLRINQTNKRAQNGLKDRATCCRRKKPEKKKNKKLFSLWFSLKSFELLLFLLGSSLSLFFFDTCEPRCGPFAIKSNDAGIVKLRIAFSIVIKVYAAYTHFSLTAARVALQPCKSLSQNIGKIHVAQLSRLLDICGF